jgi:hypothetical protein
MIVTAHTVCAKVLEESIGSETHILEPLDPQIQGKSGMPSTLISPSMTVVGTALYIKVLNNFKITSLFVSDRNEMVLLARCCRLTCDCNRRNTHDGNEHAKRLDCLSIKEF